MLNRRPKVALVVGAGGIKCAAALGVYDALEAAGIVVDLFVGCSGGSIYASFLALGYNAREAEKAACRLWTREITQVKRWQGYLMTLLPRHERFKTAFALRDDRLILERLRAAFGSHRVEETAVSLRINATNLDNGQAAVFHEGEIVEAIRASIAIPALFQPWPMGNTLFSDGMLSNPLPVDVAAHTGANIIIGVGFPMLTRKEILNAKQFNIHINSILSNNLRQAKVALCREAYEANVLILEPDFGEPVHIFDTHKIPQVVNAGRQSMVQQMGWLKKQLSYQHKTRDIVYVGANNKEDI